MGRAALSAAEPDNPPSSPRTPRVEGFVLKGVTCLPDPATNAFRHDLADTALAGRLIASHYADPLDRTIVAPTLFRARCAEDSDVLGKLSIGDVLRMLDCSRGWAWGYGPDGRVGYVPAAAIGL